MGSLTGSHVRALVTDFGAGVRHAGSVLADRRDFTLTADGRVEILGGKSVASQGVFLTAGLIHVTGELPKPAEIDPDDIIEPTRPNPYEREHLSGYVERPFTEREPNLGIVGVVDETMEAEDPRAIISAVNGNVELTARVGSIEIENAALSAAGNIDIITPVEFEIISSDVFSGNRITIEASQASFASTGARTFVAANAPLEVTAREGDIEVLGARLQGGVTDQLLDKENEEPIAGVNLKAKDDIVLTSLDTEKLAVIFTVEGDVTFTSGGDITNFVGRVIANGDVNVSANGDFRNVIVSENWLREPLLARADKAGGFLRQGQRGFDLNYGELQIPDALAFVTATGSVNIKAGRDIQNVGGEINANNGDVRLRALNVITEGIVTGHFGYRRQCFILCRSRAESSVNVLGGHINASGQLIVDAESMLVNRGGILAGLEGLKLNSREILFEALYLPKLVERPRGLYNFWIGPSSWVYWRDALGSVFSGENGIELSSNASVKLRGVEIEALMLESGAYPDHIVQEYAPRSQGFAFDQHIGLFSELAPVIGNGNEVSMMSETQDKEPSGSELKPADADSFTENDQE